MNAYVLKRNVAESNSWLSFANSLAKRIKHAAWAITIRLLHLLRTDIDAPPNGSVHCEIFEVKILKDSCSLVSRIRLHINAFNRSYHAPVPSCNVPNAISPSRRRKTSNRHSNPHLHSHILYQHISSTIEIVIQRFRNNSVVIVLNRNVVNMKSCPRRIYSISVEWEHYEWACRKTLH